tara:strand:+ start:3124 stop:4506 length:1383 start_codon:yes stop_codon:yes gene_type:complete
VEGQGRFITGSTMGHVVRMTATGAFGITFVFLVDAANLLWLSQWGSPQQVAAIGLAFAIQFFSVSIGVGLMIAATALVSRSIGRGDRATARQQAGAAMVTAASIQTVVATLLIILRHPLVDLSGATGETAVLAARYLAISALSLVPMAISLVGSGVLRAEGYGAKAMYVTLFSGVLSMFVDPFLIYHYGIDGAAAGLWVFRICLVILAIYFSIFQMKLVERPDRAMVVRLFRPFMLVALPAIATQMSTPVGNYVLTMIMARFGDDAVAAWAVVGRLTVLVFGGIFALSGAIGGIFGQNYGAGHFDRLRSAYRDALLFCALYTLVAWVLLWTAIPYVSQLFDLSGQGIEVLNAFAGVGVGSFMFVGALFVSNAAFNNLGRPGRSTMLNWMKDGVLSWPAAMLLAGSFGAAGVIYGQALAGAVMGVLAASWGWRYVARLGPQSDIDPAPPRPYPNLDRFRRR